MRDRSNERTLPRKSRRSRLDVYRDLLLAIQGSDGKLTHVMNWTGLSYNVIKRALEDMRARKLIDMVESKGDARSEYKFVITTKGQYVVQLLVELIEYIEDPYAEADPRQEPPIWLMRKALAMKGFILERPKVVEALPHLEEASRLVETEEPVVVPRPYTGWRKCPECGKSIPSKHGLKIHISRLHKDRREELLAQIK